jgi:hypothetical protein
MTWLSHRLAAKRRSNTVIIPLSSSISAMRKAEAGRGWGIGF